ncbi:MAG: hypothetical protein AVDCRST_MAG08-3732, partial [uncultured Acetobacteraceae bacterium]
DHLLARLGRGDLGVALRPSAAEGGS